MPHSLVERSLLAFNKDNSSFVMELIQYSDLHSYWCWIEEACIMIDKYRYERMKCSNKKLNQHYALRKTLKIILNVNSKMSSKIPLKGKHSQSALHKNV